MHYTVFHSDCIILLFYQECTRVPFSQHPYQHLLFWFFLFICILIIAILMSLRWSIGAFWLNIILCSHFLNVLVVLIKFN